MNKWISIGMCSCLLVVSAGSGTPVYAQKNLKTLWQKLTSFSQKSAEAPWKSASQIPGKQVSAALIKVSRQRAKSVLAPLFGTNARATAPRPLQPAPEHIRQGVFTLQASPKTHGKGSAFAVVIDNEVWGVTARHVLDDIGRSPYLSVRDENGQERFFQVNSLREGNVHGADIAIFRLPPEALAYIRPFQPDFTLPQPHDTIQSAGFSHGFFGWFPQIEVFFASRHRILTNYQDYPIRSGYCGSPLLSGGKVIGVFTGVVTPETAKNSAWYNLFASASPLEIKPFNHAVPIAWVRVLVRQPAVIGGMALKFADQPLGLLQPDENIHSIQQLRQNCLYKTLSAYPFMDYAHLERFFEIEPGDVFRIIIHKGDRSSSKRSRYWYEWNSQTNAVTRHEVK